MRRTIAISFAAGVALALAAERVAAHRGRHAARAPADEQTSTIIERLDEQQKLLGLVLEHSSEPSQVAAACGGRAQPAATSAATQDTMAVKQPETPESTAAREDAERLLRDASNAGRWTEHDRLELRAIFGQMSAASQSELMRQFAMAVNQDRIKLDHPGPPF